MQTAKLYVQTKIAANAAAVYDAVFTRGGSVVIAGSAKRMPADVTAALQQVRGPMNGFVVGVFSLRACACVCVRGVCDCVRVTVCV